MNTKSHSATSLCALGVRSFIQLYFQVLPLKLDVNMIYYLVPSYVLKRQDSFAVSCFP